VTTWNPNLGLPLLVVPAAFFPYEFILTWKSAMLRVPNDSSTSPCALIELRSASLSIQFSNQLLCLFVLVLSMLVAPRNSTSRTPDYVSAPTRKAELLAVQIPLMALALLFVGLRLASRYCAIRSPGWDDFVLIIATVRSSLLSPITIDQ